jgi:hypothetical protein
MKNKPHSWIKPVNKWKNISLTMLNYAYLLKIELFNLTGNCKGTRFLRLKQSFLHIRRLPRSQEARTAARNDSYTKRSETVPPIHCYLAYNKMPGGRGWDVFLCFIEPGFGSIKHFP